MYACENDTVFDTSSPSHNLLLCCVAKYLTNPLVNLGGCHLQPLKYGINGRCTAERGVDEVYCCKTLKSES